MACQSDLLTFRNIPKRKTHTPKDIHTRERFSELTYDHQRQRPLDLGKDKSNVLNLRPPDETFLIDPLPFSQTGSDANSFASTSFSSIGEVGTCLSSIPSSVGTLSRSSIRSVRVGRKTKEMKVVFNADRTRDPR